MYTLPIHYGNQVIFFPIPESYSIDTIFPPSDDVPIQDGFELVNRAIANPLSPPDLEKIRNAKTISIAINDKTRPVPYQEMVPPLLDFISRTNLKNPTITWISATGTHKPLTANELDSLLPVSLRRNAKIISHDCDDETHLTYLGNTKAGTPVKINRLFMNADVKILLGSIEPHHFMGYSGGAKTAVIGLASRETVRRNHAMLTSPLATTACFSANPCRIDVEEMGELAAIDLCLNVVLDTDKNIRAAFFGNPHEVIIHGIDFSKNLSQISVGSTYDLVLVSCGGYPKDINLYQAQKAVSNAAMITADGGEVILFAECREGHGSEPYYNFMQGLNTVDEVIDKFHHTGFEIGPHKAYLIARQLKRIRISVVSKMPEQLTRMLLLAPLSLDQVINKVQIAVERGQKVAFLPFGVGTVPRLEVNHDR